LSFDASNIACTKNAVTQQISDDTPFVLSMTGVYLHGETRNHSVCAWGYYEDGSDYYIIAWDTFDTTQHWFYFGAWSAAVITQVDPE
jgi:hypothetical protein